MNKNEFAYYSCLLLQIIQAKGEHVLQTWICMLIKAFGQADNYTFYKSPRERGEHQTTMRPEALGIKLNSVYFLPRPAMLPVCMKYNHVYCIVQCKWQARLHKIHIVHPLLVTQQGIAQASVITMMDHPTLLYTGRLLYGIHYIVIMMLHSLHCIYYNAVFSFNFVKCICYIEFIILR